MCSWGDILEGAAVRRMPPRMHRYKMLYKKSGWGYILEGAAVKRMPPRMQRIIIKNNVWDDILEGAAMQRVPPRIHPHTTKQHFLMGRSS